MGNDAKENPSDGFYWIKVHALVVELLARKTFPPKNNVLYTQFSE